MNAQKNQNSNTTSTTQDRNKQPKDKVKQLYRNTERNRDLFPFEFIWTFGGQIFLELI